MLYVFMNILAIVGSFLGYFIEPWIGWVVFGIEVIRIGLWFYKYRELWYEILIIDVVVPGGIAFALGYFLIPAIDDVGGICFLFSIVSAVLNLYYVIVNRLLADEDD